MGLQLAVQFWNNNNPGSPITAVSQQDYGGTTTAYMAYLRLLLQDRVAIVDTRNGQFRTVFDPNRRVRPRR